MQFLPTKKLANNFNRVGVAFKRNQDGSYHTGFIVRTPAGILLCHLEWHLRTKCEALGNEYFWAPLGFLQLGITDIVVAAKVVALTQRNSIPYGIDCAGNCFAKDMSYIAQPLGKGLTCSTFVKAVLANIGYDLFDETDWPNDVPEDKAWQKHILAKLLEKGASAAHIEAAKNDIGCKRFRPEQVSVAAAEQKIPINYIRANELAKKLIKSLYKK